MSPLAKQLPGPVKDRDAGGPVRTVLSAETEDFVTAIAGLDVGYVRTSRFASPSTITSVTHDDVMVSAGGVGFSAVARTEIPDDRIVVAIVTHARPPSQWNGVELEAGQVFLFEPGTRFAGTQQAGISASILVVPTMVAAELTDTLGRGLFTDRTASMEPLGPSPAVEGLRRHGLRLFDRPELVLETAERHALLEAAVTVMTPEARRRVGRPSAQQSERIVARCIEFAEASRTHAPTVTQLCRAASVAESTLRLAFISVCGMPPVRFFRHRLLTAARAEFLRSDPREASVSAIVSELGVTQLGRFAGHYRGQYGELPSQTLRANR